MKHHIVCKLDSEMSNNWERRHISSLHWPSHITVTEHFKGMFSRWISHVLLNVSATTGMFPNDYNN